MTSTRRIPSCVTADGLISLRSIVLAGKTAAGASIVARGVVCACSRFARGPARRPRTGP
jgi:hypothetical protein